MVFSTMATATVYVLLPSGRGRRLAFAGVGALVLVLSLSRIYLGLDNVTGDVQSALIGSGVAALAFTLLAPESQYPVTYRRRNRAHLELTASRVRALAAVAEQLGLALQRSPPTDWPVRPGRRGAGSELTIRPGASCSASSTPPPTCDPTAGTSSSASSDTGALEDEGPFASVRRLVEHEDYMLRLFRDHAVNVPQPHGVGGDRPRTGVPAGHAVAAGRGRGAQRGPGRQRHRRCAAAGTPHVGRRLAHRDVKLSNVLVQGGRDVYLVDVAFGELRPSPWRRRSTWRT